MWIIIVLSILFVIIVLLCSPVRTNIKYHDQVTVTVEYFFIRYQVFPRKPSKKGKQKDTENDQEEKKLKIVSVQKFIKFMQRTIKLASGILRDITKKSKIKLLNIKIVIGSEDAAQTAIQYGEVCALVGAVINIIGANVPIKKHDINITPNFSIAEFSLDLDIIVSIRLNTLLGILIKHGALFEQSMRLNIVEGGTAK